MGAVIPKKTDHHTRHGVATLTPGLPCRRTLFTSISHQRRYRYRRVLLWIEMPPNNYMVIVLRLLSHWLKPLQWRHNEHDGVSNHQPYDCLLNRLFRRRSKKTSKLRVTGLCVGNSPVTGEFPAQRASNTENVSIWWRHHAFDKT